MAGAGLFGPGQRAGFFRVRPLGLLLDFGRRDTGLLEEQRRLRRGELFPLGTPELEIEQADFLVLNLDDLVLFPQGFVVEQDGVFQARVGGQQRLNGGADFGGQGVERDHLLYLYSIHEPPPRQALFCFFSNFFHAALRHHERARVCARSRPASSSVNSSAAIRKAPGAVVSGQAKQPRPSRLAHTQTPVPSK